MAFYFEVWYKLFNCKFNEILVGCNRCRNVIVYEDVTDVTVKNEHWVVNRLPILRNKNNPQMFSFFPRHLPQSLIRTFLTKPVSSSLRYVEDYY